jgi:hypothetical protein
MPFWDIHFTINGKNAAREIGIRADTRKKAIRRLMSQMRIAYGPNKKIKVVKTEKLKFNPFLHTTVRDNKAWGELP